MKATLMFPRTQEEGLYLEKLAHFASRRARTVKDHNSLYQEVFDKATPEKRTSYLKAVVEEEWSLDVVEMNLFVYDIEQVPSWLMTEFLRHRLIARDWSFEQRSKRAIHGHRIGVLNPFEDNTDLWHQFDSLVTLSHGLIEQATEAGYPSELTRYAVLEGSETSFVCASNARALHHLFTMRGSSDIGGDNKAAPEFLELVDNMYDQAKEVCPLLFDHILRS